MHRAEAAALLRGTSTCCGLLLLVVTLLAGCSHHPVSVDAGALRDPHGVDAGPFARRGTWLTDGEGRVVIAHGFNLARKRWPYYPDRFGEADARFLAGEGFNVVRLGLFWAAVEPHPGVYDDAYIRRFEQLNELLAAHGIHTVIDFHQDTWSERFGGDGAPSWATFGRTADQAFQAFWDGTKASDGTDLQTHFIAAWIRVLQILNGSPARANILGLDPFNEPFPGSRYGPPCDRYMPCPAFERSALVTFYRRWLTAVRASGDTHIVLPEGIAQNARQTPALPDLDDPQTAFNWHYYCSSVVALPDPTAPGITKPCALPDVHAFERVSDYAERRLQQPWLVTEFGGSQADTELAQEVDLLQQRFVSWIDWTYVASAEEPDRPIAQRILLNPEAHGSEANVKISRLDALAVPYAQAIAGTPVACAYDRANRRFTLRYRAASKSIATRLFVPQRVYPNGYRIDVSGGAVISSPTSPSVLLVTASSNDVAVTVTPDVRPTGYNAARRR
jgi:endoglycosylceramidase